MGLFSKRKHHRESSTSRSFTGPLGSPRPNSLYSAISPSPSPLPTPLTESPPPVPQTTLRVALDNFGPGKAKRQPFTISVDTHGDVNGIRRAVAREIGETSMSLFKVSIPSAAHSQAHTYVDKFSTSVSLLTCFPAFNIDDPDQLVVSRGPAGWQSPLPGQHKPALTIRDWFPENSLPDTISVLVRTMPGSTSTMPLTLIAHYAPPTLSHSPRSPSCKSTRSPPTCIEVLPSYTIAQLKSAAMLADGRPAPSPEHLAQIILWRVDMSEEEMIVIEERGGLKAGQMPWPYPPTAPVPLALQDDSLPISNYFPGAFSNGRMVNLSVWMHPSVALQYPRPALPDSLAQIVIPAFRYPMTWDQAPVLKHASTSPPLADARPPSSPVLPSTSTRLGRPRPSTAPAAVEPRAFGSRSQPGRPRRTSPSPLSKVAPPATSPVADTRERGLGIQIHLPPAPVTTYAPSAATRSSVSSQIESDAEMPALDFSKLSFSISDEGGGDGDGDGDASSIEDVKTPLADSTHRLDWSVGGKPKNLGVPELQIYKTDWLSSFGHRRELDAGAGEFERGGSVRLRGKNGARRVSLVAPVAV